MTSSTSRVLALLELLQSGGGVRTRAELAERLAVDERTVRRYVDRLRELDVPVRAVRGRYGGYRLGPGFRLPPLMFTDDEALAVLLGLLRGPSAPGTASATAKLRRVLSEPLARRLDTLLDVTTFSGTAQPGPVPRAEDLLLLARATHERRPVILTYTNREGGSGDRTVLPYGIVAHAGRWYLTGADSRRGEVRTFRLDRIVAPALRSGSFDVPEGFDAGRTVTDGLARAPWRHAVSVRVGGDAETVRARLPAGLAQVEVLGPDEARIRLQAERLDWVPGLLAGLGLPGSVEEPEELRALLREQADRLAAYAGPAAQR